MQNRRVVKNRSSLNYSSNDTKNTKAKKNKKISFKTIFKIVIYSLLVLALIYAVVASSLFKVKKIELEGNQTLNSDSLKSQIQSVVGSSILNQNILFVSESQINQLLKTNNYQISQAKIERKPFNTIKVTITEQKPSVIWRSGNKVSIFTEDGRAYTGEPNQTLLSSLPTVEDTTNLPVRSGEKTVSEQFVKFVGDIYTQLPQKGVEIQVMQIEETTTELIVVTKQGYKIKFDTTRPVSEQVTDLIAVLDLIKKQNKKITQYIDLRINSKAFYK